MVWSSQPSIRDQEQHGDSLSAFICTFDNWDIVLLWWWALFFQNTRKHLNLIRKQQNWSSQNCGKRHYLIVLQANSLLMYTEIYQSKLENAFESCSRSAPSTLTRKSKEMVQKSNAVLPTTMTSLRTSSTDFRTQWRLIQKSREMVELWSYPPVKMRVQRHLMSRRQAGVPKPIIWLSPWHVNWE